MEFVTAVIVFLVSIIASFMGSTVGGTGLIRVPLLMLFGVPPVASVGTSKAAAVTGSIVAMREYRKKGFVHWKEVSFLLIPCIIGVTLGSIIAIGLTPEILGALISIFILIAIGFNLVKKKFKLEKINKKLSLLFFFPLFVYKGVYGGGSGSLLSLFLMAFFGHNFLKAAGTKLVLIFIASIVSSVIFISVGAFDLEMFLVLATGGAIGSILGPRFAIKTGDKFMTPVFYLVSAAMAIKLLFF